LAGLVANPGPHGDLREELLVAAGALEQALAGTILVPGNRRRAVELRLTGSRFDPGCRVWL